MPERKEQVLDISIQGSVDSSLARAIGVSEAQLAKLKDAVNTINKGFSKKAFAGAAEGFKQTEESANSFHDTMKRIGETMAGVFSAAGDRNEIKPHLTRTFKLSSDPDLAVAHP